MTKLRATTLVYLVKKPQGKITEICLGLKKHSMGKGKWNGIGGKVNLSKESIVNAAKRETYEEIGIVVKKLIKVAQLSLIFPFKPNWDQNMHVFIADEWVGKPKESKEMTSPKWFKIDQIPFENMWPDDIFWLPKVLKGKFIDAKFIFDKNNNIQKKKIKIVGEW